MYGVAPGFWTSALASLNRLDGESAVLAKHVLLKHGCGLPQAVCDLLVDSLAKTASADGAEETAIPDALYMALTLWEYDGKPDEGARDCVEGAWIWFGIVGMKDSAKSAQNFLNEVVSAAFPKPQDGPEAAPQTLH